VFQCTRAFLRALNALIYGETSANGVIVNWQHEQPASRIAFTMPALQHLSSLRRAQTIRRHKQDYFPDCGGMRPIQRTSTSIQSSFVAIVFPGNFI
jgi:hypothetical protein